MILTRRIVPSFVSALLLAIACAPLAAAPHASREDVLDLVNTLRTRDCIHSLPSTQTLHPSGNLDAVAKHVLDGLDLEDALLTARTRVRRSTVIRIGGFTDGESMKRILGNYCDSVTNPALTATA